MIYDLLTKMQIYILIRIVHHFNAQFQFIHGRLTVF